MESVILIKWFEKSKVIAQGCLAQDNEGVQTPKMLKIEEGTLFWKNNNWNKLFIFNSLV
jgi:hypothetical protein